MCLSFTTMKLIFENKDLVFKQMYSFIVAHQKHMVWLVSAESFLKKVTKSPWGIKTFLVHEASQQGREARASVYLREVHKHCIGPVTLTWDQESTSWLMPHQWRASKSNSLVPALGLICTIPAGPCKYSLSSNPLLPAGLRSLVETKNFRNSIAFPPKTTILQHCFIQPTSGLSTFYFLLIVFCFCSSCCFFFSWQ